MKKILNLNIKLWLIPVLAILFFFLETAISFSVKKNREFFNSDNEVSFAMNIGNEDSDFSETKEIDQLVRTFMRQNRIKGASVAVTKNEKLV